MFRELSAKNKQLTNKECIRLLKTEMRGVLSVSGDDGYPYGMPMNHFYSDDDGCIYFHCGKGGHRIDAITSQSKVSFCVVDSGYRNDGEWALNIKSVIVFGTVEIIDNSDTVIDIVTKLSHKFTSDDNYIKKEIEVYGSKTLLLKLTPQHICGKIVKES